MQFTHIICHYGEIAIKGKNREYFERILADNMRIALKRDVPGAVHDISREYGRIIVTLSDTGHTHVARLTETLSRIPGIVSFAPAVKAERDLSRITETATAFMRERLPFRTFKVGTKRSDKTFEHTSKEVNEQVGAAIGAMEDGISVSLTDPDATCHIEITQSAAFISAAPQRGIGGLPVGSGGKALVMLSGGIDSPVAAFYAAKRGVSISAIHFHAIPYTSQASLEKVRELSTVLATYTNRMTLYTVPFARMQDAIAQHCDPKYRILLYRRSMLRIAEALATQESIPALVTGESLGQVASQTIENIASVAQATSFPILRPLVGFDKQHIMDDARRIGTYDISIQPAEDCCTLFVPDHPETKATVAHVEAEEAKLDIPALVEATLHEIGTEVIEPKKTERSGAHTTVL